MTPSRPPRFSDRALPSYRHEPGRTPHPTRDPAGHSFGRAPEPPCDLNVVPWRECAAFRYGVDLFNAGFWWESHEVFEELWHAAGAGTRAGHLLQGLIQCAAAHLLILVARPAGARRLFAQAEHHVHLLDGRFGGLDLIGVLAETGAFVTGDSPRPARLREA